jgi:hypothetical protein
MLSFILGVLPVEWFELSMPPERVLDSRLVIAGNDDDGDDPTTDILRALALRPSFILGVLPVEWFELSKPPECVPVLRLVIAGDDDDDDPTDILRALDLRPVIDGDDELCGHTLLEAPLSFRLVITGGGGSRASM